MDRQRLLRVFSILSYLAAQPSTLSRVSKDLGLPLSSAHDLLQALLDLDAVSLNQSVYALGPRAIGLSIEVQQSMSVVSVARRTLEQLASSTQLDVYLGIRAGSGVVYAARYAGSHTVNIDIPLGRRLYLHSTSVGKLFAAFDREMYGQLSKAPKPALTKHTQTTMQQLDANLRTIRAQQISISRGESYEGVIGVAAPVRDPNDQLVAAAHLSILEAVASPAAIQRAVSQLRDAARTIEAEFRRRVEKPSIY
jgi:DNA-binding IclR family transcriptional regulator